MLARGIVYCPSVMTALEVSSPSEKRMDELMISVWTVEDNDGYRNTLAHVINQSDGMRCDQAFSSCEQGAGLRQFQELSKQFPKFSSEIRRHQADNDRGGEPEKRRGPS